MILTDWDASVSGTVTVRVAAPWSSINLYICFVLDRTWTGSIPLWGGEDANHMEVSVRPGEHPKYL